MVIGLAIHNSWSYIGTLSYPRLKTAFRYHTSLYKSLGIFFLQSTQTSQKILYLLIEAAVDILFTSHTKVMPPGLHLEPNFYSKAALIQGV